MNIKILFKNSHTKIKQKRLVLLSLLFTLVFSTSSIASSSSNITPPLGLMSDGNVDFNLLAAQAKKDLSALNTKLSKLKPSTDSQQTCKLKQLQSEKQYVQWFIDHAKDIRETLDSLKYPTDPNSELATSFNKKIQKIKSIEAVVNPTSEQINESQGALKNLRFDTDQNILISLDSVIGYFEWFNQQITSCPKEAADRDQMLSAIKDKFKSPLSNPFGITIDQATYVMEELQRTFDASLKNERYQYQVSYTSPKEMNCHYAVTLTIKDKKNILPNLELALNQKLLNQPQTELAQLLSIENSDQQLLKRLIQGSATSSLKQVKKYEYDAYIRYYHNLIALGCDHQPLEYGSSYQVYLSPKTIHAMSFDLKYDATNLACFEMNGTTLVKYICNERDVVIPNSVTSIGKHAFSNNQLTSVVIPNSVTSIGFAAFVNNQLTSIVIPNSVTSIGAFTFNGNKLTSVVIPNTVTSISNEAFASNQLASIVIPNSVITIGDWAFQNNQLASVVIPNSVTSIGEWAFASNQLASIVIPNSVTLIGRSTFDHNQLTSIVIPNSVTSIAPGAFAYNQLASIVIPNSVTSIGNRVFAYNYLASVQIPNSVTSIGERAFYGNQLTSIVIPNSVTSIGDEAFLNNHLTSVVIPRACQIGAETFDSNVSIERRPQ